MDGGGYGKAQRGRRHRTPAAGRPYQAARPRPTPVVEEPLLELAGNVEPARQSLLMTLLSNPLRLMAKVRVGGPTSCLLAGTSGPCSHHLIDRDWCLQVPVLGSYFAAAAAAAAAAPPAQSAPAAGELVRVYAVLYWMEKMSHASC